MRIKEIREIEAKARALNYCKDEEKFLIEAFNWSATEEGHSYWRHVSDESFLKNSPEILKIKDIENEELKAIAKKRATPATDERTHIKTAFGWRDTIEGFEFWQMVSRGVIKKYNHPMNKAETKPKTIAERLNKPTPFILKKERKILYKEDINGNWIRRKYNENGKLILIKKSTGKVWKASNS